MQKYYAQHGEDRWIADNWEQLGLPEQSFYVDVGALDGVTHSNTRFLDDRGWTGLCFEPDPRVYESLLCHRRHHATCLPTVIGADNQEDVSFRLHGGVGLSGVSSHITCPHDIVYRRQQDLHSAIVETLSPDALHQASRNFGILSIDTEGTELDILRAFWPAYREWYFVPRVIIVEYDTLNHPVPPQEKMRQLASFIIHRTSNGVSGCGYEWVHTTPGNMIFALKFNRDYWI